MGGFKLKKPVCSCCLTDLFFLINFHRRPTLSPSWPSPLSATPRCCPSTASSKSECCRGSPCVRACVHGGKIHKKNNKKSRSGFCMPADFPLAELDQFCVSALPKYFTYPNKLCWHLAAQSICPIYKLPALTYFFIDYQE